MKLKGTLAPKENHGEFYKSGKATTRAPWQAMSAAKILYFANGKKIFFFFQ